MYASGTRRAARIVAVILSVWLIELPGLAGPRPLGLVVQSHRARLGGTAVQTGTTVYGGDAVATEPGGAISLRLGPAQAYLGSDAQASFNESEGRVAIEVTRGTLGFTVAGEETLVVYAAGLWIRPQTAQPTHAEITVTGEEARVRAVRGALEVIDEGESYVVPEASSYEVVQEVAGVGAEQVKKKKRWRRAAAILLIGGTVTCVVLFNTHPGRNSPSPSSPANGFCR